MTNLKTKDKKVIALTWWGTWGHIFPLLSIYNSLKDDNKYKFFWAWQEEWLEYDIALENNIDFLDIPSWKIRRYFDLRNFYEPLKNLTWIFFWIYFILRYKVDIVFSKWWFVSLPLCIAAFLLRKKIYIHESDIVQWLANKIIWKIATKVFYSFPNAETLDKPEKNICSWQILNKDLLENIKDFEISENWRLNVLVTWWSQWSTIIFESLLDILPNIKDIEFKIILWEKNLHFKDSFRKFPNVRTYDFINQKDLWLILKQTDIAITRWWATSLWELNVFWIHSIIIPLEWSAWDHQYYNAMYFRQKYWSDLLDQNEELTKNIYEKLNKYKTLRKAWLNLDNFYKATDIIKNELNK